MLTKKALQALRLVRVLNERCVNGPVLAKTLVHQSALPPKHLELVLCQLTKSGLLKSRRGPGGGYTLARNSSEITLLEVLRAVNERVTQVPCDEDPCNSGCPACYNTDSCSIRSVLRALSGAAVDNLNTQFLA